MAVLGSVVDQEEQTGRGQAVDEAVEQGLGLGVDPVQVLEHHDERLDLALAQEQALDGIERLLPSLQWVEPVPGWLLHGDVEQRQQGRYAGRERRSERKHLPRDLLANLARFVAALDLEVAAKQRDDRQIGG